MDISNFVYALAFAIAVIGIAFFFRGIITILFEKLKSIQVKADFSDKDKSG